MMQKDIQNVRRKSLLITQLREETSSIEKKIKRARSPKKKIELIDQKNLSGKKILKNYIHVENIMQEHFEDVFDSLNSSGKNMSHSVSQSYEKAVIFFSYNLDVSNTRMQNKFLPVVSVDMNIREGKPLIFKFSCTSPFEKRELGLSGYNLTVPLHGLTQEILNGIGNTITNHLKAVSREMKKFLEKKYKA